jgi:HPr kinase/phosphorylase
MEILLGQKEDIIELFDQQIISISLASFDMNQNLKGRIVVLSAKANRKKTAASPEPSSFEQADKNDTIERSDQNGENNISSLSARLEKIKEATLIIATDKNSSQLILHFPQTAGVFAAYCPAKSIKADLAELLQNHSSATEIIHGVLLDVAGVGTLITGESGIGKSETALELISKGHLLIADDAVIIRREGNLLIGNAPEIIRHLMEIRGIGIIDITAMFGAGSVKIEQEIDLIVRLEPYSEKKNYMEEEFCTLKGIGVPQVTLPIRQGRNISVLIEIAAKNLKLNFMGYDANKELQERLKKNKQRPNSN